MFGRLLAAGSALVGLVMTCGCGMTGGSTSTAHTRAESVELLNRPGLVVTHEEYDRAVMKQKAQREGLSALDEAQANVAAYDAQRAKAMAMREAQLRAAEDQKAAVVDAAREQEMDKRRATVTAISQSVEPVYQHLRDKEAAYQKDAEAVRLRRGVK